MTALPAPVDLPDDDIFLGRQSIVDRDQNLRAFELLFRSGIHDTAQFTDGSRATATVIRHLLTDFGIESVLGRCRGFVNLDAAMVMSDMIEILPADRVVLELLETITFDAAILQRVAALKRAGYTLALDDVTRIPEESIAVMDLVDIVKVDILPLTPEARHALVRRLRAWPVTLLAEKVDSRDQFDACRDMGFELFQGYYFARPQIVSGRALTAAQATIMRVLGLVMADGDAAEIETAVKMEPALMLNVLRLANSSAAGLRRRIDSVGGALMLLGQRQVLRIVQLMLYSLADSPGRLPGPLMQLAATRARMMELLAGRLAEKGLEDRAFLTGMMSLLDTLLGMPLADILRPLPVADDVRAALISREGRLGALLALAESTESIDPAAPEAVLPLLPPLTLSDLRRAEARALAWANGIGA